MDEIELFLPVVDGSQPAKWPIWNETLGDVCDRRFEGGRWVDEDILDLAKCNLNLGFYENDSLFQKDKSQWGNIIGVVVDGKADHREGVKAMLMRITQALLDAPGTSAWYRKIGFWILVIVETSPVSRMDVVFAQELKTLSLKRLGLEAKNVHHEVAGDFKMFNYIFRSFDQNVANLVLQERQK